MEFHGDWVKHTMRIDHKSMPIEVHCYFDDPYSKEEKPLRRHYNVIYHVSFSALYKWYITMNREHPYNNYLILQSNIIKQV